MKRVIIDFDNTIGIEHCDIDDALALLTLLGNPDRVALEGITTTYGNSTIENVTKATNWLVNKLHLSCPVHTGGASKSEPISNAARYLVETVSNNPGEIYVLVTGSCTNLKGAVQLDPNFFTNVAGICAMGGIRNSLYFNGEVCNELNFSCDPEAALLMLSAPCPVNVAVSQNCLPAAFTCSEYREHMRAYPWLHDACEGWMRTVADWYKLDLFIGWDMVAALYLAKPEMFQDCFESVTLNERLLSVGYLEKAEEGWPQAVVNFPRIKDASAFIREIYRSMEAGLQACGA